MSEKLIPSHVDPFRHAEQSLRLDGQVKVSDMERLQKLVLPSDSKASVSLQFGIDEQKITYLKGSVECELTLQCQRCLEPFTCEIMSNFTLGIVKTFDAANDLPDHYEPALATEENSLALRDLIEDELILNLPIIPKHAENACEVKLPVSKDGEWEKERQNPFKVLESLKHKQKESGEQ